MSVLKITTLFLILLFAFGGVFGLLMMGDHNGRGHEKCSGLDFFGSPCASKSGEFDFIISHVQWLNGLSMANPVSGGISAVLAFLFALAALAKFLFPNDDFTRKYRSDFCRVKKIAEDFCDIKSEDFYWLTLLQKRDPDFFSRALFFAA